MMTDEQRGITEQLDDDLWVDRQREVEQELTFTLNLLDQAEDETRQWHRGMLKRMEAKGVSAYDTRWVNDSTSNWSELPISRIPEDWRRG